MSPDWKARAEAAEAELARLRVDLGTVTLQRDSMRMVAERAHDLLIRQAGEIEQLEMEKRLLCRDLKTIRERDRTKAKTLLQEAVEVMRWLNRRGGLGHDVHERVDAFLEKNGSSK